MGTSPVGLMLAAGKHTASGLGVPLAFVLLVPMEAGIPIPIPADKLAVPIRTFAALLAADLEAGRLPDMAALHQRFAPDPACLPTVVVHLVPLQAYESLIGKDLMGDAA